MSDLNPNANIARSKGVDLPILTVYLAGRISGENIKECLEWRKHIVDYYKHYEWDYEREVYVSYPISFLDALNSKEADSVDEKGLKSRIPPNLIYDKDLLSVKKADVVVANLDDFLEVGIEDELKIKRNISPRFDNINYKEAFLKLQDKILNRRENFGTISEVAWCLFQNKPLILIVPKDKYNIYSQHPFSKRASVIVTSVEKLLEEKWLEVLYKSIAGSTGVY